MQNMYQQHICPSYATIMAYSLITWCTFMWEVCQYTIIYKFAPINCVAKIAVYKQWQWWCRTTMPQSNFTYPVGHLAFSQKNLKTVDCRFQSFSHCLFAAYDHFTLGLGYFEFFKCKEFPPFMQELKIHSTQPIIKKNIPRFCFVIGGFSLRVMYLQVGPG